MKRLNIVCIIPSSLNERAQKNIRKCVKSLSESKISTIALQTVVVTHGDATSFSKENPRLRVIYSSHNCFSSMNNIGVLTTLPQKPDFYIFINDDACVSKEFFYILQKTTLSKKFDILCPLVYTSSAKEIDSFGSEYFTSGHAKNSRDLSIQTTLATAACVVVKTSLLRRMMQKYGFLFNPIYGYYFEDVEFSIRALAIGATILKEKELIAFHLGSQTSIYKSKFVMHHTYRNALWVMLITWPCSLIFSHLIPILVIHAWNLLYGSLLYGPLFPFPIYWETTIHLPKLFSARKKVLSAYKSSFKFQSIFSKYAYRTKSGRGFVL